MTPRSGVVVAFQLWDGLLVGPLKRRRQFGHAVFLCLNENNTTVNFNHETEKWSQKPLKSTGRLPKSLRVGKRIINAMKRLGKILGAILFASFIMVGCNQNSTKQKELELKERELALKEKELALKEQDSTKKSDEKSAQTVQMQESPKLAADMKILTLMSPTYELGDLPHLSFQDFTTHKVQEYECNWDLPAIKEITSKCEGNKGCPALKGQIYSATLKLKLLDVVEFNPQSGSEEPTGKKEKRWVIIALQKKNIP